MNSNEEKHGRKIFVSVMVSEEGFGGFCCLLVMSKVAALFRYPVGHSALPRHINFLQKKLRKTVD